MTNGEKIISILKPRKDQIKIYGNWVEMEIQKLGINFSCGLDWWNAEYEEPTTETLVSLGVYKQVAWERDIAIQQLHELGYEFGQKIELTTNNLVVDAVRRKAVLNTLDNMDSALDEDDRTVETYKELLKECYKVLPPVTPIRPKGHWIPIYQGDEIIDYRCSECEFGNTFGKGTFGMNFCPRCGSYNGGDNREVEK